MELKLDQTKMLKNTTQNPGEGKQTIEISGSREECCERTLYKDLDILW